MAVLFLDGPDLMRAAKDGIKQGLIEPVMVGNRVRIEAVASEVNLPLQDTEILDQENPQETADLCLALNKKYLGRIAAQIWARFGVSQAR